MSWLNFVYKCCTRWSLKLFGLLFENVLQCAHRVACMLELLVTVVPR